MYIYNFLLLDQVNRRKALDNIDLNQQRGGGGGVVVYQYTRKKKAKIPKNTQN